MDDAERNYRAAMLTIRARERINHPKLMAGPTRRERLSVGVNHQPMIQQLLRGDRGA
jgi:hypothetical protein